MLQDTTLWDMHSGLTRIWGCTSLVAMCLGCGAVDDPAATVADTLGATAVDTASLGDAAAERPDSVGPDSPDVAALDTDAPWTPPPTALDLALTPLEIAEWRYTTMAPSADGIADAVEFGTLTWPEVGADQGAYWYTAAPGEGGEIALNGSGQLFYAVARVTVPKAASVVANLDGIATAFVGGRRYPGDPYRSGRHRVPLRLSAGENLLVVRGFRRNSLPRVTLEQTAHEVFFNAHDLTAPHVERSPPHPTYVGLPVLNLTDAVLFDVRARVLESDVMAATELRIPALGPATVQVPFELRPKPALPQDGTPITITLTVSAPGLSWSYAHQVALTTKTEGSGAAFSRTFRSRIDRSVQYYGYREPTEVLDGKEYGLVLSLHGAGVQAQGQAASYSQHDWNYLVAATNRRPFGFDWESFGRLDGLEVLDLAQASLPIDPRRVHVTGHSMGGHGTWQLGHLFPGRFAVVGPSAGWISFESYAGPAFPTGLFGWASLSAQTLRYSTNLAQRAVYIIHGTADDNVPLAQAQQMLETLEPITPDLHHHFEEGAGHWWDGDVAKGVDCVDWPPLFELMADRTLDVFELNFQFTSPSPGVSPRHSYVVVRQSETPAEPFSLTSAVSDLSDQGLVVALTTQNVRGLTLDGDALLTKGVTSVVVDGEPHPVAAGAIDIGPTAGKRPEAYGPLVQAFQAPFCLVYAADGPVAYANYAAFLLSTWNILGNGAGCMMPLAKVTDAVRHDFNLIYLGIPRADVPVPAGMPMSWNDLEVSVDGAAFSAAALAFVFPDGDRLGAVLTTTRTHESLLFRLGPFNSRFWVPDWLVFAADGGLAAGFWGSDWAFDPALTTL